MDEFAEKSALNRVITLKTHNGRKLMVWYKIISSIKFEFLHGLTILAFSYRFGFNYESSLDQWPNPFANKKIAS